MLPLGLALTQTWLVATACVLGGLSIAVIAGKARRDMTERAAAGRRARLASGMEGPNAVGVIGAALRDSSWVQVDLLVALHQRAPDGPPFPLGTDVDGLLNKQALKAREAGARGRAVLLAALLQRPNAVTLGRLLLHDKIGDVRLAACTALGLVGTPEATRVLLQALDLPTVAGARIVEQLATPAAAPTVCEALPQLDTIHARSAAIRAIGLSGHLPSGRALRELLSSDEVEIRIAAVRALGELGDRDAAHLLLPLLRDDAWEVRAQATRALGMLEHVPSVGGLAICMGDENWWVRSNAADALTALGAAGHSALLQVAHGPDRYAAERARQSLAVLDVHAELEAA